MAITCNFEREENELRKGDKMIVRVAPGQVIGTDTPALKPVRNGAYLWVMNHRRRSGKSWRDLTPVN